VRQASTPAETSYNRSVLQARSKPLFIAILCIIAVAGLIRAHAIVANPVLPLLRTGVNPSQLKADGETVATISLENNRNSRPLVSFFGNNRGAVIEAIEKSDAGWRIRVRAGVLPGPVRLTIEAPGYKSATVQFNAEPDSRDTAQDGTPDFLRLTDDPDREAFRNWFVWLAEAQYFQPPSALPAEIDDCAALIRFAYRAALRLHDSAWANSLGLPELPALNSPAKYHYPFTPLGASLFRIAPGPFVPQDLTTGKFRQFADAQTLWRFNTDLVGRNLSRALPGDLLFFRRAANPQTLRAPPTFHAMIYVGESKIRPDGHRYLLYHTGPAKTATGVDPGEIRRPTTDVLLRFPQPEWRPVASNPAFLGVMRWNILSEAVQ
jgi:uncharacterized protein YfaT (DUF1175 family)